MKTVRVRVYEVGDSVYVGYDIESIINKYYSIKRAEYLLEEHKYREITLNDNTLDSTLSGNDNDPTLRELIEGCTKLPEKIYCTL